MTWNGLFKIHQSNMADDTYLDFYLVQMGNTVSGSVSGDGKNGEVNGSGSNSAVNVVVNWSNGQSGRYVWSVDANGTVTGHATDLHDPQSGAILTSQDYKYPPVVG